MTEPVVATLDPVRKLEILKEYSKHLKNKNWSKGLKSHVELVEKVYRARNIAAHQPIAPGNDGKLCFRGAAAAKILRNLKGEKLPVSELQKAITVAEKALWSGENLPGEFQEFKRGVRTPRKRSALKWPRLNDLAMTARNDILLDITPQVLLKAYAVGIFPMAELADDPGLYWIEPEIRGILPLDAFHVSRRLKRTIASDRFEIRIDSDFDAVIGGCAEALPNRPKTWINGRIRKLYGELFDLGACHTVEVWRDDRLVGGLYGVSLGAAFFGESMFSRERDASKVALVYLVARLKAGGYRLLDTQFTTSHLKQFGAIDIDRRRYQAMLDVAIGEQADFYFLGGATSDVILQSVSQTS